MNIKSILLVQPMHEKKMKKRRSSISFPWGLAYLSTYYQKAGYRVEILDGQALQLSKEELLPEIERYDFDAIGISAFSTQYPAVKLVASKIKEERGVPVIIGGPLATYQPELVLKTTRSDICVIGEGEITGIEVLKHLDDLGKVKGIAFRNKGIHFTPPQGRGINLDELSFPDFSLFDMERYMQAKISYAKGKKDQYDRGMTFITSRGCPYNCHFCSKSSRQFKSMSPKKIYEMIAALKSEFRLEKITFGDELFFSSKSRFRELQPLLKSLNMPWGAQARVNLVDKEFLDMIKDTGCAGIGYGIESGSQKILDNMNKNTTVEQIESAMRYTQKIGIPIKVQLIFGYPGEDETTVQETIELFKRVDHPGRGFNVITPIPGSELYDYSVGKGLIKDESAYLSAIEKSFGIGKVHVNFTKWKDDEIYPRKRAAEKAMQRNYYNKTLSRRTKRFFTRAKDFMVYRTERLLARTM